MSDEMVRRLRFLASLNGSEHGGLYETVATFQCIEAMQEAADVIESLLERLHDAAQGLTP